MHKVICITGSTDGIGKLAALRLAKEGHTIQLHGRNKDKLHASIAQIQADSQNDQVQGYIADFADTDSTQAMANEMLQQGSKIDVLINNAGILKSSSPKTASAVDIRFAVNYFAPFVLTNRLLPLLQKSSSPRIINLSSAAQAPVSLDALVGNDELSTQESYAQSKLALTMWSMYLARQKPNIGIIAVNPGSLLNTKMVQEAYSKYWSSADKGANILYDLSISEAYNNVSGKYFDNDKGIFDQAHADAYDQEKINSLIAATESFLKKNTISYSA